MDTVAFIGISSTKSRCFVDTVEFIGMPSTKSGCFVDTVEFIGMPSTKSGCFVDMVEFIGMPSTKSGCFVDTVAFIGMKVRIWGCWYGTGCRPWLPLRIVMLLCLRAAGVSQHSQKASYLCSPCLRSGSGLLSVFHQHCIRPG